MGEAVGLCDEQIVRARPSPPRPTRHVREYARACGRAQDRLMARLRTEDEFREEYLGTLAKGRAAQEQRKAAAAVLHDPHPPLPHSPRKTIAFVCVCARACAARACVRVRR